MVFHRTLRIGEVELPEYLKWQSVPIDTDEMDKRSGRYLINGFMGNLNTFDVFRDGENFFTSGQDDTNGELFPPYRSAFEKCTDGCFRWQAWPGIVTFHDGDDSGKITIEMPGIGIYDGERVGDAQPA